jgi:hypothetical protein
MPPSKKPKPVETGTNCLPPEGFQDSEQFYDIWKHCGMDGFIGSKGCFAPLLTFHHHD